MPAKGRWRSMTSQNNATTGAVTPLVELRDVRKLFPIKGKKDSAVHAVDGVTFDIRERGANKDSRRTLKVITDDDLRGIADSLSGKGLMDRRGEWDYSFTELGQSAWVAMMGERGAAMARLGGAQHGSKDGR